MRWAAKPAMRAMANSGHVGGEAADERQRAEPEVDVRAPGEPHAGLGQQVGDDVAAAVRVGQQGDDLEQRRQAGVVALVDLVAVAGQPLAGPHPPGHGGGGADLLALDQQVVGLAGPRRRAAAPCTVASPAVNAGYGPAHVEPATRTASVLVASSWSASSTSARSIAGPNVGDVVGPPHRGQPPAEPTVGRPSPVGQPEHGRHDAEQPAGRGGRVVVGVVHAERAGDGGHRRDAGPAADGLGHPARPADIGRPTAPATSPAGGSDPVHSSSATCS